MPSRIIFDKQSEFRQSRGTCHFGRGSAGRTLSALIL